MTDTRTSLPIPSELIPFLPALYVAWADGELSQEEIVVLRSHADGCRDGFSREAQEALEGWLNPEAPPSSADLIAVLCRIRSDARALPDAKRLGLAELGMSLARADAAASGVLGDSVRIALERMEHALGLLGSESTRELSGGNALVDFTLYCRRSTHRNLSASFCLLCSVQSHLMHPNPSKKHLDRIDTATLRQQSFDGTAGHVMQSHDPAAVTFFGKPAFPEQVQHP